MMFLLNPITKHVLLVLLMKRCKDQRVFCKMHLIKTDDTLIHIWMEGTAVFSGFKATRSQTVLYINMYVTYVSMA